MAAPDAHGCRACAGSVRPRRVGVSELWVCTSCGMGEVAIAAGHDYWQRVEDPEAQLVHEHWTTARANVFGAALDRLEQEVGRGRLLDVGGGVGYFAECALARGWDAYSLDPSPVALDAAARRVGPERSLAAVPDDLVGACDAVTAWCVVAHVRDPREILAPALAALRPGGRLFLSTPNFVFQKPYASVVARLGRPIDFVAHDHLLHFTPAALDRLLGEVGLSAWTYVALGVTESCVVESRLSRPLVPLKRAWNASAARLARLGLPLLVSELQVIGVKAGP